jgi:hypothetical protein
MISDVTRSIQPVINSTSITSISLGLHNTRIPQNDGRILCPTENTIAAMDPTVGACRDAPQIPGASPACDAQMVSAAATRSHP